MSNWPATKARRVLAALERIGWRVKRQSGSHRVLARESWPDSGFAFHDQECVVLIQRGVLPNWRSQLEAPLTGQT